MKPQTTRRSARRTNGRQQPPKEVFDDVFQFTLWVAARKGLLWGEQLGSDSTTIQASASMESLVRKDSGRGWKDNTKKLTKKAGLDDPTDAELRQLDKKPPGKKAASDDWKNPNDPDAPIARMKNGATRMATRPSTRSIWRAT